MFQLKIGDTATPALQALIHKLGPEGRKELFYDAGETVAQELIAHFDKRESSGLSDRAQRGWPQQHFWARIARATGLAGYDEKEATVSVADPAILLKIYGGTVKPKTGKFLALPMRAEAYGKFARSWPEDTFFKFTSKSGKSFLAQRDANGALRLYYRLLRSTTHSPDPKALPAQERLIALVSEVAMRHAQPKP